MPDLLTNYLACWNETDSAARRELLRQHWAQDATYTDPMVAVHGLDELDATIAAVQAQFPGFVFSAAGPLDAHHDQARFTWNLGPADGDTVIVGSDVVIINAESQIATVLGFLDRVPF
ncbi:MAG: nuclear transport factor 2 family protein [Actinomycetota bacterium]|nr:nuclear transport factor 2 family protein [Actinomycetota bacterium]